MVLGLNQLDVVEERVESCLVLVEGDVFMEDWGWVFYVVGKIRSDIQFL